MNTYEIRIYFKKNDTTKIFTATAICLTRKQVQIVDYETEQILYYNKDDVKIEYIKEIGTNEYIYYKNNYNR